MRKMHRYQLVERARKRREIIDNAACPKCGAEAGQRCVGVSGLRRAPHRERSKLAPRLHIVRSTAPSTADKEEGLLLRAKEHLAVKFEEDFLYCAAICQSPIERLMLLALMSEATAGYPFHLYPCLYRESPPIDELPIFEQNGCWLIPQVRIGPYRADFVIINNLAASRQVVIIECDGHDFHEKTKEQAAHDKRRDRYFAAQRYTVLHFTGSEIYQDAQGCAEEALGHVVPL